MTDESEMIAKLQSENAWLRQRVSELAAHHEQAHNGNGNGNGKHNGGGIAYGRSAGEPGMSSLVPGHALDTRKSPDQSPPGLWLARGNGASTDRSYATSDSSYVAMTNTVLTPTHTVLPPVENMTESMPVGSFTLDEHGSILEVNPGGVALLRAARHNLLQCSFSQFILPQDQAIYAHYASRLARTQTLQAYEIRMQRDDGTLFFAHIESIPITQEGQVPHYRIIVLDTSRHHRMQQVIRESGQFAHAVLDGLTAHVAVLDATGHIIAVNDAWRAFATDNATMPDRVAEGANYLAVCEVADGPDAPEASQFAAAIRAVFAGEIDHESIEYPCVTPAQAYWFVGHISRFVCCGATYVVVAHEDITARKQAEQAYHESDARLHLVARHIDEAFWLTSPDTSKVLYVSPTFERLFGHMAASFAANPGLFFDMLHPEDREHIEYIATGPHDTCMEYRILHPDGTLRWFQGVTGMNYNRQGAIVNRIWVARDVTELKTHEARIQEIVHTDRLTGLPNRQRLYDIGQTMLANPHLYTPSAALMYLDLNRFKAVNDTMGHDVGDDLLVQVAERLEGSIRDHDILARPGGDEFAILMTHTDTQHALTIARRILEHLAQPFYLNEQVLHLEGSIGIAIAEAGDVDFNTLLMQADIAMYRAKASGGGVQVYDPDLSPILRNQLQLETELRQALDTNGLMLCYQPILNLRSGQMIWLEALVRWPHHIHGLLEPGSFLPLAEEAGLLCKLDQWVLRTALKQAASWAAQGHVSRVAVNLTAQSLQSPELVDEIADMLRATGVPASSLMIELTEHTALHDRVTTGQILQRLKRLGVQIALDDFGSGYASLSHLRQLPVDVLKLDRAFAAGIGREARDESVMQALLKLGHGLDLTVVVEGIEYPEQLAWLHKVGCPLVQGYLIGRPCTPDMIGL
jgi:diguanylate cyclase (GGDEF)-like protein/PAS domain S-box-containing protein